MKNQLHIYGQAFWHNPVIIVGDVDALIGLKKAIERALNGTKPEKSSSFTSDGEGYDIHVVKLEAEEEKKWNQLMLPYTDDCAEDPRWNVEGEGIKPGDLVKG